MTFERNEMLDAGLQYHSVDLYHVIKVNITKAQYAIEKSFLKIVWTVSRPYATAPDKKEKHIEGFQPEWYISTIYQCEDIPFCSETLINYNIGDDTQHRVRLVTEKFVGEQINPHS